MTMLVSWKVFSTTSNSLEVHLNDCQKAGWEIYEIVPGQGNTVLIVCRTSNWTVATGVTADAGSQAQTY